MANSAFYEHMFLANEIGGELVEGRDLVVRNRVVHMRTTEGLRRVDVIYRRMDDDFLDPLVFRSDSLLGVPGLMEAYRHGSVVIANAPGTGVADDKSVYPYVPDLIRYYLSEDPILANVPTRICRRPDEMEHTLANLDRLVVKRVGESGGYGMLVGPHATPAERDAYAREVRANPADFISQPVLALSRAPLLRGRPARAAPRRSAPVRAAGTADPARAGCVLPRRPPPGQSRRELEPGRRRQGRLGAGRLKKCCWRATRRVSTG